MPAPLFRRNTLEHAGFGWKPEGFEFRGAIYSLAEVSQILRYAVRFETKVLLVGSDFTHSISVVFATTSGHRLQITEQSTWFYDSKPNRVARIQEIYESIAARSFDAWA